MVLMVYQSPAQSPIFTKRTSYYCILLPSTNPLGTNLFGAAKTLCLAVPVKNPRCRSTKPGQVATAVASRCDPLQFAAAWIQWPWELCIGDTMENNGLLVVHNGS